MSQSYKIELTDEARALMGRFENAETECVDAMREAMDRENTLTVSHIQRDYMSFGRGGPSNPLGLRVQTGSARSSLRASAAVASANGIQSSIGGFVTKRGVNYLEAQEFGATIPPHTIVARGRCLAFTIGGKKVFAKSVKHPGMTLQARGMIQRGIRDRLPQYGASLSNAVVATLGGRK